MKATNISKKDIITTPAKGITLTNEGARIAKVAKIVNTLCPANILANNLTDNENGLAN